MKIGILIIITLFIHQSCTAQFGMPSIREVANYYFTHYSHDVNDGYLRFQRKKEGWFVSLEKYEQLETYVNTALIWKKAEQSFQEIDYPAGSHDTTGLHERVEAFFRQIQFDFDEYGFGRALYYGYAGWDWDVINEPINEATVTDTVLESVARAYSSYASGFVADQFGYHFVNGDSDRVLLPYKEKISKARLDKLIDYDVKSIAYYAKIKARNPKYDTKVGNIAIKEANEYLFLSYWLALAGDSSRALTYARKASYPDSLLRQSKNYLYALPKNSILITGGDNDTYPVWYVQAVDHFRQDIVVVNYSLLAVRRQLLWLDKRYNHQLITTPDSIYLKQAFDYALYSNKNGDHPALKMKLFLQELTANHNPYVAESFYYNAENIRTYYTKKVLINDVKYTGSKEVSLGDVFLMNDFMLFDIIQTKKARNIYITFNGNVLEPLLTTNGILFKLGE